MQCSNLPSRFASFDDVALFLIILPVDDVTCSPFERFAHPLTPTSPCHGTVARYCYFFAIKCVDFVLGDGNVCALYIGEEIHVKCRPVLSLVTVYREHQESCCRKVCGWDYVAAVVGVRFPSLLCLPVRMATQEECMWGVFHFIIPRLELSHVSW